MDRDLDPVEVRVLGCLIEKQRTTPDQYPLSLNALRNACNQTTNRNPIVAYDEEMLRGALQKLGRRRYSRLTTGHTSRAAKYRHLLDDALGLSAAEISLLAVLMLRGPQTPGELNQRTGRLHSFVGLDEIHETLEGLAARGLVERLERRAGQKEERYRHLLGADDQGSDAYGSPPAGTMAELPSAPSPAGLEGRVAALEEEVKRLRDAVSALTRAQEGPA